MTQTRRALRTAQQILPADHIEAIRTYYADRTGLVVLSEADERIRQRALKAWTLRGEGYSNGEVVALLMEMDHISERTAWRDIKDAIELFGDMAKSSREAERQVLITITTRLLKKAEGEADFEACAKLIAQLSKMQRFDRDEPDMPDFSRLQTGVIARVLDETSRRYLEALERNNQPGVYNLNDIEFTPFETLPDDNNQ